MLGRLCGSRLEKLGLIGNRLSSYKELKIFEKFGNLRQLDLYRKDIPNNNPFCEDLKTYYSEVLILKNIENL